MYDLVLKNCNVVNENVESQVDIAIKNERIEKIAAQIDSEAARELDCLLYTSPSPRDGLLSRMPSSA